MDAGMKIANGAESQSRQIIKAMTDRSMLYLAFALAVVVWAVVLTSCATLESIPFSVSYQLQDGSSVTISKPRIIREK